MKNFKLGFTIAEVATALAIVGVVAALVMPLVVKNMQKQQAGPLLGRAVQQIELGCQNAIQLANSNSIDGSMHQYIRPILKSHLFPGETSQNPGNCYSRVREFPAIFGL